MFSLIRVAGPSRRYRPDEVMERRVAALLVVVETGTVLQCVVSCAERDAVRVMERFDMS